jgi:hypothetical protein
MTDHGIDEPIDDAIGEPADRSPISEGVRSAETLAGFLTAPHQEAPAAAPANPGRARRQAHVGAVRAADSRPRAGLALNARRSPALGATAR